MGNDRTALAAQHSKTEAICHYINESGGIAPRAREIIDCLNGYSEISPSGCGVKVWVRGALPITGSGRRTKAVEGFGGIEVYQHSRFFTVTGWRVEGTPASIEERQEPLATLYKEFFSRPRVSSSGDADSGRRHSTEIPSGFRGTDEALLAAARSAENGAKFAALFDRGDLDVYDGDDSAADLALCNLLVFWTGASAKRMDRLFRRSKLMRGKWNEKRGERTYGQRTVDEAIGSQREVYQGHRKAQSTADVSHILESLGTGAPRDVFDAVPQLALLGSADYGRIKAELREQFGRIFSLRDLDAAVKEHRRTAARSRPSLGSNSLRIRARITCSFGTAVILSAAKNLAVIAGEILRCAQDDDKENGQVISARILKQMVLPQNLWAYEVCRGAPPQTPGFFEAWLRCPTGAGKKPRDHQGGGAKSRRRRTLGLVIPCRVASPRSPAPFGQAL